jgi:hypothetical protein
MISMGTARTTVFDADGPRPSMVCKVRSCMAPGLTAMVAAAAARFSAARRSPSALVMVARFSRSAAAARPKACSSSSPEGRQAAGTAGAGATESRGTGRPRAPPRGAGGVRCRDPVSTAGAGPADARGGRGDGALLRPAHPRSAARPTPIRARCCSALRRLLMSPSWIYPIQFRTLIPPGPFFGGQTSKGHFPRGTSLPSSHPPAPAALVTLSPSKYTDV